MSSICIICKGELNALDEASVLTVKGTETINAYDRQESSTRQHLKNNLLWV